MDIRVLEFATDYKDGKARDWVLYGSGDSIQGSQTWARVKHLIPPESFERGRDIAGGKMFHMKAVWSVIGPRYDAWKANEEMPEEGIPLTSWSALNKAQIAVLHSEGIKTVDQLSIITDASIEKIKLPDTRRLRDQAKLIVEGREASDMAKEVSDVNERLNASVDVIAEMQAKINELEQAKPKRGRPKKEEAA